MTQPPCPAHPLDFILCVCGCDETEHDGYGRCAYCTEEDCSGFTYDEDGTVIALATFNERDKP